MLRRLSTLVIFCTLIGVSWNSSISMAADKDQKAKKKDKAKKGVDKPEAAAPTLPAVPAKPSNPVAQPIAVKALSQLIDTQIMARLDEEKVAPTSRCTDGEFIRRASLDLIGVIPTVQRTEEFLKDSSSDKRAKLIDELLADPRFGQRLGDQFGHLMYPMDSDNRFVAKQPLIDWLKDQFNANKPWDQLAFQMITATGDSDKNPETIYYQSNRGVDKQTDSVTKLFLGLQLQCAQCHNHPFSSWKQEQYWSTSQFFMKVNAQVQRKKGNETIGENEVSETGRINRKMNPLPDSALAVPARFLDKPTENLKLDPNQPYRPVLAEWITRKNNPYFAKAFVNRVWESLFGRALTEAVDNVEGDASHPELFEKLSSNFAHGGFDVKNLFRAICLSETYQRSSKPSTNSSLDHDSLYDQMDLKAMTPEQLYDSLNVVLGDVGKAQLEKIKGTGMKLPASARERFVNFFQPGDNTKPSEFDSGIPQVLKMMNSSRMNAVIPTAREVVAKIGKKPDQIVDRLYLMTVARTPTENEKAMVLKYVSEQKDPTTGLGDVLWALLNSSEFVLNH
jgi:hypothetical protein